MSKYKRGYFDETHISDDKDWNKELQASMDILITRQGKFNIAPLNKRSFKVLNIRQQQIKN